MKFSLKSLYLTDRVYYVSGGLIVLFAAGYYFPSGFGLAKGLTITYIALILLDILMLYNNSTQKIKAKRSVPEKLSNGDENIISIYLKNNFSFKIHLNIIDEIPFQFQKRDFLIKRNLDAGDEVSINYMLRPVKRGAYLFGNLNLYVSTIIGFVERRFTFDNEAEVAVYPSFIQMRKYELMAVSNRLTEAGIKKIRKISNNVEFEQIRTYVAGDDYRLVNWKATARKITLMVNQYQDEKAQRIYSIIDMGRTMKMPFNNMSLLDYAVNSALVISNIAIYKQDKAGIITFDRKIRSMVPAERKNNQMNQISEVLYRQETNFDESDFNIVYTTVKRKIPQRSLLLIYTNFEGLISLERQLQYFKQLAKSHLVTVIFFDNTEIKSIRNIRPKDSEEVYIKTIAEKYAYDKKMIVKELKRVGVHSVLTEPQNLTVDTINKYLEFKARGLI